jgi:hypothetical protein
VTRRRSAFAVGVAAVLALSTSLATACSTNDNGGTVGEATDVTDADVQIALVVDVTEGGEPVRSGSVTCSKTTGARSTGHLIDAKAAVAACVQITTVPLARQLLAGESPPRPCPAVPGSDIQAHVAGTIDGDDVDVTIDRNADCGVADWDTLVLLLGPPVA